MTDTPETPTTPEAVLRELLTFRSTDKDEVAAAQIRLRAATALVSLELDDGDVPDAGPDGNDGNELVIRVSHPS